MSSPQESQLLNTLEIGDRRLGWECSQGDIKYPALLERTEDGIYIELLSFISKEKRENNVEGDFVLDNSNPPSTLLFRDNRGFVELTGCSTSLYRFSWGPGPRARKFLVARAILDGTGTTWASASGLRTIHPALDLWIAAENIKQVFSDNEDDLKAWYQYELSGTTEINLDEETGLQIFSYPTPSQENARRVTLESVTELYSKNDSKFDFEKSFEQHKAINSLLVILSGQDIQPGARLLGSSEQETNFSESPLPGRYRWNNLIFNNQTEPAVDLRLSNFLIPYHLVGEAGLKSWLNLYTEFEEGVKAVVRAICSESPNWEGRLADVAIAFEKIGSKLSPVASPSFYECVKSVCMECPEVVQLRPERWADALRISYRGLKHAGRTTPEASEMFTVSTVGINILRLWTVQKLVGIDKIPSDWRQHLDLFYPWFWPPLEGTGERIFWG